MARTLEEVIAILEADLFDLQRDTDYDDGFAAGISEAIFLLKQVIREEDKMMKFVVKIDYKSFEFWDKNEAMTFALMAAKASYGVGVSIEIKRETEREAGNNE